MPETNDRCWNYVLGSVLAAFLVTTLPAAEVSPASPRERLSINDNWRFVKGDPPGDATNLLYDIRPQSSKGPGNAPPENANPQSDQSVASNQPATDSPRLLKAWILPTGNDFIKDPSRRFARPNGNPGEVPFYA